MTKNLVESILTQIESAELITATRGGQYETFGGLVGTIYIATMTYQVNSRLRLLREGTASVWKVYLDGIKVDTFHSDYETILSSLDCKLKAQKDKLLQEVIALGA